MKEYLKKYFILRRHEMKITWKKTETEQVELPVSGTVCEFICSFFIFYRFVHLSVKFYILQYSGTA